MVTRPFHIVRRIGALKSRAHSDLALDRCSFTEIDFMGQLEVIFLKNLPQLNFEVIISNDSHESRAQ